MKKVKSYESITYICFFCNSFVNLSFSAIFTNKEASELGPKVYDLSSSPLTPPEPSSFRACPGISQEKWYAFSYRFR